MPLTLRYFFCAALVLALFIGELTVGAVAIPLKDVLATLAGGAPLETWRNILLEFRLPRALNALFSGAALGTAGLLLQTLFRNPLADPFVLGLVHASRLGAAVLVVATGLAGNAFLLRFGLVGDVGLALASVGGATVLLLILGRLARRTGTVTLLLVGLMCGYFAVGLISALLHFIDESQASAFKIWDDASFAGATPSQLALLAPVTLLGFAGALGLNKPLDALLLGDRYAASSGIAVQATRRATLLIVAGLAGVVVAFCGPVAFLGLVAAQLARGSFRASSHLRLLPGAALIGAALALAADWVTHLPWSRHVFHLNAVIGLVGAPVALWVLLRSRAMRSFET